MVCVPFLSVVAKLSWDVSAEGFFPPKLLRKAPEHGAGAISPLTNDSAAAAAAAAASPLLSCTLSLRFRRLFP